MADTMKRFLNSFFLFLSISITLPAVAINLPSIPWTTIQTKSKIVGNSLASLLSYQNQETIIKAYETANFLVSLPLALKVMFNSSKRIDPLPEEIETVVKKMGMKPTDVNFYKASNGTPAYATIFGNVTLDPEVYDKMSPDERTMVLGHELTHIKDHHHIKSMAANFVIHKLADIISKQGGSYLDTSFNQIAQSKYVQQYPKMLAGLQTIKDATKVTIASPLFKFFMCELSKAMVSRHFEKSADLTSAQTLDCAQGGVSFFNKYIENDKNRSWLSCLKPRNLFLTLQEKLGFASHPECTERVKYLSELATKHESVIPNLA